MRQIDHLNSVAEIERGKYLDKVADDMLRGAQAYYIQRKGIPALIDRLLDDAEHLCEFDREA